jgi:hypothetical protein
VLQSSLLAQGAEEPVTVLRGFAAIEPASGDPLRFSPERPSGGRLRGSPSFVPERFCTARVPGSSPGTVGRLDYAACQLLQSLRFLSTTVDVTLTPHASPGVTPLLAWFLGSIASCDASLAELSRVQGPTCALQRRRRLPAHEAREFYPSPIGPDTSCHEPVSSLGRRSRARIVWDEVPTSTPADSARPSAQGLHHPTFREEDRDPRTRGAFHRWAAPKGWFRDSTGCHQPVEYQLRRLFNRRDNPRR